MIRYNKSRRLNEENLDLDSFKRALQENPTNREIKRIIRKYGYEAKESFNASWGTVINGGTLSSEEKWNPEIFMDTNFNSRELEFRIQTTSYGALKTNEYQRFLEGCENAYNLIRELERVDFSGLTNREDFID